MPDYYRSMSEACWERRIPSRLLVCLRSTLSLFALWLLVIEYCVGTVDPQQARTQHKLFQELTDSELIEQLSSREEQEATAAVEEIVRRGERMIPVLLKRKGDKRYFWGALERSQNSQNLIFVPSGNRKKDEWFSKRGMFVTVEVAALYLVTAIYHDSLNIAQGPYLVDDLSPDTKQKAANTKKLIKRGWRSVDRWVEELNKEGMGALRARKHGPLDDANIRFY